MAGSHIVIAGLGGLGSAAALYLAYAGVGKLTLIDHDNVQLSNLNRQILYWEEDLDKNKTTSAIAKLVKINSAATYVGINEKISAYNVNDLIEGADMVLDGLDSFSSRFILNKACYTKQIPFIHAAVWGMQARLTTIIPPKTPCLECLYPKEIEEPHSTPIIGATAGLAGCLEALEAIKFIGKLGKNLLGKLFVFNFENLSVDILKIKKNKYCHVCNRRYNNADS